MKLIIMFTLALCTGGMDRRNDEQSRVIIGKCCTDQCNKEKNQRFCKDQTFMCWVQTRSCNKKQCKCHLQLKPDTRLYKVSCNIINTKSVTCNPVTETTNPKITSRPRGSPGGMEEDKDSGHGNKGGGAESEPENDQGGAESDPENDQDGAESDPENDQGGAESDPENDQGGAESDPENDQGGAESDPENDKGGAESDPENDQGGAERDPENDQGGAERDPENDQGGADTNGNQDTSSVLIAILVTLLLCIVFFTIIIIIIIYKHKRQVTFTESQLAARAAGGSPEQVETKSKIITIYTMPSNPEVLGNTKPDHCYEEICNAPPEDGRCTLYVTIGLSASDQQIPSETAQQQEDRTYSELASTGRESSMA